MGIEIKCEVDDGDYIKVFGTGQDIIEIDVYQQREYTSTVVMNLKKAKKLKKGLKKLIKSLEEIQNYET